MNEVIYRPPFEENSFLLQVTHGCSHNKCSFCTMYREVPFSLVSDEEIEAQLKWGYRYYKDTERVFLENGDPFALSTDKLCSIAEKVHSYLPKVKTIAMYASVNNIIGKSNEDLSRLRNCGINDLNIGVESGLDEALSRMNKGYTAAQATYELKRLKAAGFDWGANIIFGAGGRTLSKENAEETAKLLNETKPYLIFTGTIHADMGCPLYDELQNGLFEEPTIGEYFDEIIMFLSKLNLDKCFYFGLHPSNIMPIQGILEKDKDILISKFESRKQQLKDRLNETPVHAREGAIVL